MEIPEINMISDFEAGMKCLENPSSISRFFSLPGIFFKWGALVFAILATFSSVIRRIKIIFIRLHTVKQPSLLHQNEEINEFSEDDDVSLASSDDEQEEPEEENSPSRTSFCRSQRHVDEDFSVKGFRWSEFTCGKNVVKLWDSLGLSLDFDEDLINYDSNDVVSLWEREYSGDVWNLPSTKSNGRGNCVVLRGYDARMRRRIPALYGEWRSTTEEVNGISNGASRKVYVRDDVSGVVTVGDVRNMRMPLGSMRESDGETWWDADAAIVENE